MIRQYAKFSHYHPWTHRILLLISIAIFAVSTFMLLVKSEVIFGLGLIALFFPLILFSKASDYRRKFFSH